MERERRAHPRKLVSTGVSFNDVEGATLRGWLHDISRGGCFVATPSLFTYGEEITIHMTLPFPRQTVAGKARVVWVREKNDKDMPAGMGMAFVEVNEDALVAIDKLALSSKLSRPKTVIGIAPPAVGSSPSYSDVRHEPLPEPELGGATEPEGVPVVMADEPDVVATEPLLTPPDLSPPPPEPEPKKSGREKLIIGGAAAVSALGLVALGVVYTRHKTPAPAVDAATTVATIVDAAPAVPDAAVSSVAVVTPPPPIVDASVADAASDAGPRDAGGDAGKKKPKPKNIKRK